MTEKVILGLILTPVTYCLFQSSFQPLLRIPAQLVLRKMLEVQRNLICLNHKAIRCGWKLYKKGVSRPWVHFNLYRRSWLNMYEDRQVYSSIDRLLRDEVWSGEVLPVDDDGVGGRLVSISTALLVTTPTGREETHWALLHSSHEWTVTLATVYLDSQLQGRSTDWMFSHTGKYPSSFYLNFLKTSKSICKRSRNTSDNWNQLLDFTGKFILQ